MCRPKHSQLLMLAPCLFPDNSGKVLPFCRDKTILSPTPFVFAASVGPLTIVWALLLPEPLLFLLYFSTSPSPSPWFSFLFIAIFCGRALLYLPQRSSVPSRLWIWASRWFRNNFVLSGNGRRASGISARARRHTSHAGTNHSVLIELVRFCVEC